MKGMLMSVYRRADGEDFTNGGVTSRVTKVVVTGEWFDGTKIPEIHEPSADAPEMKIASRLPGSGYFHAEPVEGKDPDKLGWMDGGNYVSSSDSRCPDFPIPVHDRQETQEQYDLLSR